MLVDGVGVELQSAGCEREVWGADKRELSCTVDVEEGSEEWEAAPRTGDGCEAVQVVFYYERPPDRKKLFYWRPGSKMDIHNGWWEDGKLIVDDR